MVGIKDYVMRLAAVTVLIGIVSAILPNGRVSKTAKAFFGLIIAAVALEPLLFITS